MTDYQSVIMNLDQSLLRDLGQLLAEAEIALVKGPQTGLLMMVARDPFAADFCLGEILITEAETEYQDQRGYAMVLGEEPERAVLLAAVTAVGQSSNEALKKRIESFLAEPSARLSQWADWQRKLLTKTLVSFETMVKR